MRALVIATFAITLGAASARAEDSATTEAEATFTAIRQRAASGELAVTPAIDQLETLGALRPVTRWTDDAWAEAARLAERAGDFGRARRALEQVIAVNADPRLVGRARVGLARLAGTGGATGQWDAVAAQHEQLAVTITAGGDPRSALEALEALVRANPGYPRGVGARLALAQHWEAAGEVDRAITWLFDATRVATRPDERERSRIALARALIRHDPDRAATEITAVVDREMRSRLVAELAAASRRTWIHRGLWAMLALSALLAIAASRRAAGSWSGITRLFARPPTEVIFIAPIALVIAGVAQTGNSLVARAVGIIAVAGIAITWISGALLDARRRTAPVSPLRALLHATIALAAAASIAYLAIDRGGLSTMVVETWREGPQH